MPALFIESEFDLGASDVDAARFVFKMPDHGECDGTDDDSDECSDEESKGLVGHSFSCRYGIVVLHEARTFVTGVRFLLPALCGSQDYICLAEYRIDRI